MISWIMSYQIFGCSQSTELQGPLCWPYVKYWTARLRIETSLIAKQLSPSQHPGSWGVFCGRKVSCCPLWHPQNPVLLLVQRTFYHLGCPLWPPSNSKAFNTWLLTAGICPNPFRSQDSENSTQVKKEAQNSKAKYLMVSWQGNFVCYKHIFCWWVYSSSPKSDTN